MSTEFEFDAKVKEADDIDIKEYSFSPTLLENGVIDYSNIEHDKIFLVNKKDILENPLNKDRLTGYCGKIARIDLTSGEVSFIDTYIYLVAKSHLSNRHSIK